MIVTRCVRGGVLLSTLLVLALSFACSASAQSSQAINGPLKVSLVNPRYFTNNSGKAVYLTGSNSWGNFQDMGFTDPPAAFDYNAYLNFLTKYNHNFIRLWMFENTRSDKAVSPPYSRYHQPMIYSRTGPGSANDGKLKFNLYQFNQSYFDRLRQKVIAARDRGIYVGIMLFEGFSVWNRGGNAWYYHPYNPANNASGIDGDTNNNNDGEEVHSLLVPQTLSLQEAYVRKVIDTVNDLDNVLYEISNEDNASANDWQNYLINFIKNYEKSKPKQHPVGKTSFWDFATNPLLYNSPGDWVSPTAHPCSRAQNCGTADTDYAKNPPAATGKKVELLDTDHIGRGMYEKDGDFARAWVWKSLLRGYNPIYLEVLPNSQISKEDYTASWGDTPFVPARYAMGYTLTYANKMNLIAMTPQNSLSSTAYCLANVGNEYLVYQPDYTLTTNSSFTVSLSAGTYIFEWFNPITGKVASTGTITASGGNKSFTAPFPRDAVLYIKKSGDTTAPNAPSNLRVLP